MDGLHKQHFITGTASTIAALYLNHHRGHACISGHILASKEAEER
jgi:hypothetical protein